MSHFLGTTEHMILLAVLRGQGKAHGAGILQLLHATTGRAPSSGSLSTSLDRLEKKGFITSIYESGNPQRGGRPRRVVSVTPEGLAALSSTSAALAHLKVDLDFA